MLYHLQNHLRKNFSSPKDPQPSSPQVSGMLFPPFHLHRLQYGILWGLVLISFGQFHHSVCVLFLKDEIISINGISSDPLDEIR